MLVGGFHVHKGEIVQQPLPFFEVATDADVALELAFQRKPLHHGLARVEITRMEVGHHVGRLPAPFPDQAIGEKAEKAAPRKNDVLPRQRMDIDGELLDGIACLSLQNGRFRRTVVRHAPVVVMRGKNRTILLETLYEIDGLDDDVKQPRNKKRLTRDKVKRLLDKFVEKGLIKSHVYKEKAKGRTKEMYSVEIQI